MSARCALLEVMNAMGEKAERNRRTGERSAGGGWGRKGKGNN